LEEHYKMLYEKCVSPEQKTQLRNTYSAARYAFWKFDETEPAVKSDHAKSTYNDLKITNSRITAMLKKVDDIAEFLSLAAEAVRLAEFPAGSGQPVHLDQKGA
jgi:hypothetical protein